MFHVMSKRNDIKEAAEAVFDVKRPLAVAEKKPAVGKGGAAFKSLTAAVKAAEREKKEAVEAMVMAKAFAVRASESLVQMEALVRRHERFLWRLCGVLCGIGVVLTAMRFF